MPFDQGGEKFPMSLQAGDEINFSVSIIKMADRYVENGQHDIAKILVAVSQMLLFQRSPVASALPANRIGTEAGVFDPTFGRKKRPQKRIQAALVMA